MVFSSIVFLFYFLPVALLLYHAAPRGLRFVVLTLCSYAFYAWSDPWFVLLLIWVTFFDFVAGNVLGGVWRVTAQPLTPLGRRIVVGVSLVNSLGLLAFFKYGMMTQELYGHLTSAFGGRARPVLDIVLPAGISFYNFESISYIVDIHRGNALPASVRFRAGGGRRRRSRQGPGRVLLADFRAFLAFACYLAQFPHLVAGPIIRYQELEPQLHSPSQSVERFARGIMLFSFGLAKKVLLANTVAAAAAPLTDGTPLGCLDTLYCIVAFAFQIYFDFCGYSDMAVGLALMLGFDFPKNFDAPYRARSITEFWSRWHITLSNWLRDYLYIPLGGNRRGPARTYLTLMVTMLLGGLWHGAALQFAVWGLYHGALLAAERAIGRRSLVHFLPVSLQVAFTFALVSGGWVFFQSPSLPAAAAVFMRLNPFTQSPTVPSSQALLYAPAILTAMTICALAAFSTPQAMEICRVLTLPRAALAMALLIASLLTLGVTASNPFLYFQF